MKNVCKGRVSIPGEHCEQSKEYSAVQHGMRDVGRIKGEDGGGEMNFKTDDIIRCETNI